MSGCSDSRPCPVCGQDMEVYTDWKPFDTVSMTCLHCGFYGYVQCGMQSDEERKAAWSDQGRDEADFVPLPVEAREVYLNEFKALCETISPEDEARYLGRPVKPMHKVIIAVEGGVAHVKSCPESVAVMVVDHGELAQI